MINKKQTQTLQKYNTCNTLMQLFQSLCESRNQTLIYLGRS